MPNFAPVRQELYTLVWLTFRKLVCMKLWKLCQDSSVDSKLMPEAQSLQALVSRADWAASNANVSAREWIST